MTEASKILGFAPSGFFVLRTPLLPFQEMMSWSEGLEAVDALDDPESLDEALDKDRRRLRERLLAVMTNPQLRDAIFVASPTLDEGFKSWQREPNSKRGRKVEAALVSYFSRAAARSTPFGLFAGCTAGTIDIRTCLQLQGRHQYQRHSRLDMDYLWALAEALQQDPRLRAALTYQPNSSLYEAAGRLRLAEARLTANRRSYHLVAVDKSPYLTATLERAMGGATLAELANALVNDEITQTDAEEYITELVDSQILMADVRPSVTGDEPIHHLITTLTKRAQTAPLASQLDKARMAVEAIDADGLGVSPDRYRTVASLLSELPYQPELSRLVQVDLAKPGHEVTLGSQVVAEASRGVRILYQLRPPALPDSLSRFREDFLQRYETREVPLAEALDEETGIGFEVSNSPGAGASPLLAGLPFGSGQAAHPAHWNRRDTLLMGKLTRALSEGVSEISIEASDLEGWSSEHQAPLPDAFHVMATVVAASEEAIARGAFRVLFDHMAGPSGAQLLGRFCHADQALLKSIRAHLHAEQARRPECIFAEIAHLPEGRIGNILCRPVLRDYEISYLGRSGAPADRQIPVTDLLVSVRGDRIVLRSRRFGREVVPRLTTAHNYGRKSLGVYRFLCSLQHQDVTGYLAWNWGPLGDAPFLPRVVSGRLVLSRARWNLAESELQMLGQAGGVQGFAILQKWRKERRLPRYVALADGDNELVIDFDNILSIETLAHQVRGRRGSALVEMFPRPSELCVSGPEGRFLHEVIVPFIRVKPVEVEPRQSRETTTATVRRRFPPGSEWLYVKLYVGTSTADQVLNHLIGPVVGSAFASGAADSWFFIRYGDPDWHLRVRLHGSPERLHTEVLPRLQAATAALVAAGQLWRVQFDTYEREVERYGGEAGIELAEQIFHADSDAVLAILGSLSGDAGLDLRWRLALRGIDRLFDDLQFTLEEKRFITRKARDGYGREFGADGNFWGQVGQRYRTERSSLEALFDPVRKTSTQLVPGLKALRRRSLRLAPTATELRRLAHTGRLPVTMADVAISYAHMHVNRLLRSAQRAQELVLYELLDRFYASQAGRSSSHNHDR